MNVTAIIQCHSSKNMKTDFHFGSVTEFGRLMKFEGKI